MDTDDKPLFICLSLKECDEPYAPAVIRPCHNCGTDCWVTYDAIQNGELPGLVTCAECGSSKTATDMEAAIQQAMINGEVKISDDGHPYIEVRD